MTAIDLDHLAALAEGATQGEWTVERDSWHGQYVMCESTMIASVPMFGGKCPSDPAAVCECQSPKPGSIL